MKGDLGTTWNKFAKLLLKTKEAFEEHRELHLNSQPGDWESLPMEFQRFVGHAYNRSTFDKMLEALVPFLMTSGGFEQIRIETEEEKEKKIQEVVRLKDEMENWILSKKHFARTW